MTNLVSRTNVLMVRLEENKTLVIEDGKRPKVYDLEHIDCLHSYFDRNGVYDISTMKLENVMRFIKETKGTKSNDYKFLKEIKKNYN